MKTTTEPKLPAPPPIVRMVAVDEIVERRNPRQTFAPEAQKDLEASIKAAGILQPLLLRPLGKGFERVAGARRLRAAKTLGLAVVPAYIRDLSDDEVEAAQLMENTHHTPLGLMEEAAALRTLLKGRGADGRDRTLDEVAAIACKDRRYVRERLLLTDLIPEAQALVEKNILPLQYATRLARIPHAKQREGLERCFLPLFKGPERYQRQYLCPQRDLDAWLQQHVRLDLSSSDTAIFQPELIEQVQTIQARKRLPLLHLSSQYKHVDRSAPPLLLRQQWEVANTKDSRCEFARAGVVELGEGAGTIVDVCVEKACPKHRPRKPSKATTDRTAREETERQQAIVRAREAADRRWRDELRPQALSELRQRVRKTALTQETLRFLLSELGVQVDQLQQYVGPLGKLGKDAFVAALLVGIGIRHSWTVDAFRPIAKRFRVKLAPPSESPSTSTHSASPGTPTPVVKPAKPAKPARSAAA